MADEKTQWSAPKQKHTTLPLTCKVDRLYPPQTGKKKQNNNNQQSVFAVRTGTGCTQSCRGCREKTEPLPEKASRGVRKSVWYQLKVPHYSQAIYLIYAFSKKKRKENRTVKMER